MSQRIKTSVYYISQLLIVITAIATGLPARADTLAGGFGDSPAQAKVCISTTVDEATGPTMAG